MENKEIHGYIYLITNKINEKQYIGQTTRNILSRFSQHVSNSKNRFSFKTPVIYAIKKYGKENFIIQELALAYNQKQLNFLEGLYIEWFNTLTPNGYNLTKIINGKGKHSEESKEKIRASRNKPNNLKLASIQGKNRQGKPIPKTSKYCGVSLSSNKYVSNINFNNNRIYLGIYNREIDAAKVYDIAAIKYFGNDSVLNFPELRKDYINNKIIVKKCCHQDGSKSGVKGIYFHKQSNKWIFVWFDKNINKRKSKYFETLEEAIEFKNLMMTLI